VIEILWPPFIVPANSSRFFRSQEVALEQPTGVIRLGWDSDDPFLYNTMFDSSLIRYDEAYCTSVVDMDRVTQLPTLDYFDEVTPYLREKATIVDIGCGQGEFVDALRYQGWDAIGFDPVVRRREAHLHARYWEPEKDRGGDLFVMRCVLPHIPNPWSFLAKIAESSPGALVLIEFQRLEWIITEQIWYQISHDHVNLFSAKDFSNRYAVLASGEFRNSEWGWVLVDPGSFRNPRPRECNHVESIQELLRHREGMLDGAASSSRRIAIWGGAGKGIVLGHALRAAGVKRIAVIDADPNRWDRFLETSGIKVISPATAQVELSRDTQVLVCNPNHLPAVQSRFGDRWQCDLPSVFGGSSGSDVIR